MLLYAQRLDYLHVESQKEWQTHQKPHESYLLLGNFSTNRLNVDPFRLKYLTQTEQLLCGNFLLSGVAGKDLTKLAHLSLEPLED